MTTTVPVLPVSDLVRAVAARTASSGDVAIWVRQRRQGHWYREYRHLYEAVDYAAQFTHALGEAWATIKAGYETTGYGYASYPHMREADYGMLLARTAVDRPKHAGV